MTTTPLIYQDPRELPPAPSPSVFTAPPISPPATAHLFKRIFNSISRAFASLISCLSRLFSCSFCFSTRKVKQIIPNQSPLPNSLGDRNIIIKKCEPPILKNLQKKEDYAPSFSLVFDDSLEDLRASLREFVAVMIAVVHEQQIVPHIAAAQEIAPSIPPVVKSITKLLIEMGDKAAKPLFQKLVNQKAQSIDPALKKILTLLLKVDNTEFRTQLFHHLEKSISTAHLANDQKTIDYINPVIDWVCSPELQRPPISSLLTEHEDLEGILINTLCAKALDFHRSYQLTDINLLYSKLEDRLITELKESRIPPEQELAKHYVRPILDWLLRSDQSEPIASLFLPKHHYSDTLIDQTFEWALTAIVEHNIDHYANRLDNILQHRLQEIVHNTIQTNAQTIVDFLTERAAELITEMPFPQLFDSIVQDVIASQIAGCAEAEEASQDSLDPTHTYLKKFGQHAACTPYMQQIIQQHLILTAQGKDSTNARKAIEKAFHVQLTDKLLNLMLPIKKRHTDEGVTEEIDPFFELWSRLSFPEELYTLSEKIEEIAQEFITVDTMSLFANIKQPALEIARNIFKNTAQDIFKKQFSSLLQNLFEKLTLPEEIDKLMGDTILPEVNNLLLTLLVENEFKRNAPLLMPHFHRLISDGSHNQETHIEAIQSIFIPKVKAHFQQFSGDDFHVVETEGEKGCELTYKSISDDEWLALTREIIQNTHRELLEKMHADDLLRASMPTQEALLALFIKEPQKAPVLPQPIYGDIIITNLLGKLGGWNIGNAPFIGNFIHGKINASAAEILEEIRTSHHFLAKLITKAIKNNLTSKEKVFELLYTPPSPPSNHDQEKLDHQMSILSKLAYDLIVIDLNKVVKFGIQRYIKNDSSAINALITTLYKKCLGKHMINENLLMHFCENFFQYLHGAAEKIKHKQNITLHLDSSFLKPQKSPC